MRALEGFLRPEFINRVDEIITFRALDKEDFKSIAGIMMNQLAQALSDHGVRIHYTDAVLHVIAEQSFSAKYGARNMRRYIQKTIEDAIANEIIGRYDDAISMISLEANAEGNGIEFRYV